MRKAIALRVLIAVMALALAAPEHGASAAGSEQLVADLHRLEPGGFAGACILWPVCVPVLVSGGSAEHLRIVASGQGMYASGEIHLTRSEPFSLTLGFIPSVDSATSVVRAQVSCVWIESDDAIHVTADWNGGASLPTRHVSLYRESSSWRVLWHGPGSGTCGGIDSPAGEVFDGDVTRMDVPPLEL